MSALPNHRERTRLAYSHGSEVSSSVFGGFRVVSFSSRLSLLSASVGSGSDPGHTRRSAADETIANNLNFFILCFGI
jgi:hypothetical protein